MAKRRAGLSIPQPLETAFVPMPKRTEASERVAASSASAAPVAAVATSYIKPKAVPMAHQAARIPVSHVELLKKLATMGGNPAELIRNGIRAELVKVFPDEEID